MVNTREKIFLVAGSDFFQRKLAINNIKKRILSKHPSQLNFFTLYSKELKPSDLEKQIFTFSFDAHRLLVFKGASNLSASVKKFLITNFEKIATHNYLIFEIEKKFSQLQADKKFISDSFFSMLTKKATILRVTSEFNDVSIEDFKRCIRRNDLSNSLYTIERLFKARPKDKGLGPQVLGILTYNASYARDPLRKKESLYYIWEADRAMKERGHDARLVIETLLVRLFKD